MVSRAALPCLSNADVEAMQPALLAYARRAVGNPELAAELVQETLLAAVAAQHTFQQRSALRSWCIGILTHKAADLFRARRRARLVFTDEVAPEELAEPTQGARIASSRSVKPWPCSKPAYASCPTWSAWRCYASTSKASSMTKPAYVWT
jgi:hypothetical protein